MSTPKEEENNSLVLKLILKPGMIGATITIFIWYWDNKKN